MLITDRRERSQWGSSHICMSPHDSPQFKYTDVQKCEHFHFPPSCNSWCHRHFAKFMHGTCDCQHVISARFLVDWHPLTPLSACQWHDNAIFSWQQEPKSPASERHKRNYERHT